MGLALIHDNMLFHWDIKFNLPDHLLTSFFSGQTQCELIRQRSSDLGVPSPNYPNPVRGEAHVGFTAGSSQGDNRATLLLGLSPATLLPFKTVQRSDPEIEGLKLMKPSRGTPDYSVHQIVLASF